MFLRTISKIAHYDQNNYIPHRRSAHGIPCSSEHKRFCIYLETYPIYCEKDFRLSIYTDILFCLGSIL